MLPLSCTTTPLADPLMAAPVQETQVRPRVPVYVRVPATSRCAQQYLLTAR